MVWNAAAHIPRIVEVHISIDAESWYITCIPALFHVSCEARRAAARVYAAHQQGNYDFEFLRPQILINFAVDTIFLARNFEAYYFLQDIKLEERGRIRSLAIAQDIFSRIRLDNITLAWFGIYPHEMKDLKELIVLAQRRHIHTHPCAWFKTHRREEVLEALWRVKSDLLDSQRRPSIEETRIWQNWGELWALLKNLWKTIEENEGVVRRLYVLRSVAHKFSGEDEAMVFANIERIQWLRRGPRLIYSELLQRKIYTL